MPRPPPRSCSGRTSPTAACSSTSAWRPGNRSTTASRRLPATGSPSRRRLLIDRGVITRGQLAGSVIASAAEDPDNRVGRHILVGKLRGDTWKAWDTERRDWAEVTFVGHEEQIRLWPRAAVSHPGLARILELGSAEGRTFVASEHIPGVTLAATPRDDRGLLVAAIRDAAAAVGALHQRKLTHGGISLETIVLDASGSARVTGWGSGDRDVPALGAALYELLTDRPAPKDGLPKSWPKRLNEDLRAVLTKALSSAYADAGDLANDLARL